nr:MAG TPA: hypothetical protein [Caudoviricetes sp.]
MAVWKFLIQPKSLNVCVGFPNRPPTIVRYNPQWEWQFLNGYFVLWNTYTAA